MANEEAHRAPEPRWATRLKWVSMTVNVAAGILISLNVPQSAWAFPLFALANLGWAGAGWSTRDTPLALVNVFFLAINGFGAYRWLAA